MIVSESYGFAFFHVPKTAGSAVTVALSDYSTVGSPVSKALREPGWQNTYHEGGMYMRVSQSPRDLDDFYTFAFVRNPFDTIASLYAKSGYRDFSEYVANRGWTSQLVWTQSQMLDGWIDYIGEYETLEADWEEICRYIGIDHSPLTNVNTTKNKKDYRTYYTDTEIQIVADIFDDDLTKFGYSFD